MVAITQAIHSKVAAVPIRTAAPTYGMVTPDLAGRAVICSVIMEMAVAAAANFLDIISDCTVTAAQAAVDQAAVARAAIAAARPTTAAATVAAAEDALIPSAAVAPVAAWEAGDSVCITASMAADVATTYSVVSVRCADSIVAAIWGARKAAAAVVEMVLPSRINT